MLGFAEVVAYSAPAVLGPCAKQVWVGLWWSVLALCLVHMVASLTGRRAIVSRSFGGLLLQQRYRLCARVEERPPLPPLALSPDNVAAVLRGHALGLLVRCMCQWVGIRGVSCACSGHQAPTPSTPASRPARVKALTLWHSVAVTSSTVCTRRARQPSHENAQRVLPWAGCICRTQFDTGLQLSESTRRVCSLQLTVLVCR